MHWGKNIQINRFFGEIMAKMNFDFANGRMQN
jgi:hypothetical protein